MKQSTYEKMNFFFEVINPILAIVGIAILMAAMMQAAGVADFREVLSWPN